jgi:hypothetical protein
VLKLALCRANSTILKCLHELWYAAPLYECVREVAGHPGVTVRQDARSSEAKAIVEVKISLLHVEWGRFNLDVYGDVWIGVSRNVGLCEKNLSLRKMSQRRTLQQYG